MVRAPRLARARARAAISIVSPLALATLVLASCATAPLVQGPLVAIIEPRPSPGLDLSKWSLRWQEEFDGPTLDLVRWRYLKAGPELGFPAGIDSARGTVRLDGLGHLVLSTRLLGGRIEVPLIGTRDGGAQSYGYFECSIRAQRDDHATAFVRLVFASGASIDLVRASQPSRDLALQSVGPGLPGGGRRQSLRVAGLSELFHRFGLLWSPSGYSFYVDGVPTLSVKAAITELPSFIVLGMSVDKAGAAAIGSKPGYHDELVLDYVRIYRSLEGEGP